MTTQSITTAKAAAHSEIEQQTAEFLARGNKIDELPHSPDGYTPTGELEAVVKKNSAARAKGMTSRNWKKLNDQQMAAKGLTKTPKKQGCKAEGKRKHAATVCSNSASRERAKKSGFKDKAA